MMEKHRESLPNMQWCSVVILSETPEACNGKDPDPSTNTQPYNNPLREEKFALNTR